MTQRFSLDRQSFEQFLSAAFLVQQLQKQALRHSSRDDSQPLLDLVQIQQDIETGALDLESMLHRIVVIAIRLTGAKGAGIWLFNHSELAFRAGAGTASKDQRLTARILSQLASSAQLGPLAPGTDFAVDESEGEYPSASRSLQIAPIYRSREIAGTLAVFSDEACIFTARDATNIRLLAGLIAHALDKAAEMALQQSVNLERAAMAKVIERLMPSLERLVIEHGRERHRSPNLSPLSNVEAASIVRSAATSRDQENREPLSEPVEQFDRQSGEVAHPVSAEAVRHERLNATAEWASLPQEPVQNASVEQISTPETLHEAPESLTAMEGIVGSPNIEEVAIETAPTLVEAAPLAAEESLAIEAALTLTDEAAEAAVKAFEAVPVASDQQLAAISSANEANLSYEETIHIDQTVAAEAQATFVDQIIDAEAQATFIDHRIAAQAESSTETFQPAMVEADTDAVADLVGPASLENEQSFSTQSVPVDEHDVNAPATYLEEFSPEPVPLEPIALEAAATSLQTAEQQNPVTEEKVADVVPAGAEALLSAEELEQAAASPLAPPELVAMHADAREGVTAVDKTESAPVLSENQRSTSVSDLHSSSTVPNVVPQLSADFWKRRQEREQLSPKVTDLTARVSKKLRQAQSASLSAVENAHTQIASVADRSPSLPEIERKIARQLRQAHSSWRYALASAQTRARAAARHKVNLQVPGFPLRKLGRLTGAGAVLLIMVMFLVLQIRLRGSSQASAGSAQHVAPIQAAAATISLPAATPRPHPTHLQITDENAAENVESLSNYEMTTLRRQAEYGDETAEFELGMAYETGHGVSQNCAKAASWVTRAASGGNAAAQYNLGLRYRDGDGVPASNSEAERWLRKASDAKYPAASKVLTTVATKD